MECTDEWCVEFGLCVQDTTDDVALADVVMPNNPCPPARTPIAAHEELDAMYGPVVLHDYQPPEREQGRFNRDEVSYGTYLSTYLQQGLTLDQVATALDTTREAVAHELGTPTFHADQVLMLDNLVRVEKVDNFKTLVEQVGGSRDQIKRQLRRLGLKVSDNKPPSPTEDGRLLAEAVALYDDGLTYAEIGKRLGVTRQQARQMYVKAKQAA